MKVKYSAVHDLQQTWRRLLVFTTTSLRRYLQTYTEDTEANKSVELSREKCFIYIPQPSYSSLLLVYILSSALEPLSASLLFSLCSKEEHEKHLCCRSFGVALAEDRPCPFALFCPVMPFLRSTQGPAGFHLASSHFGPLYPLSGARLP